MNRDAVRNTRRLDSAWLLISAMCMAAVAARLVRGFPRGAEFAILATGIASLWTPSRTVGYRSVAVFLGVLWSLLVLIPLLCIGLFAIAPSLEQPPLEALVFISPQMVLAVAQAYRRGHAILPEPWNAVVAVGLWSVVALLFGYATRRITNLAILVGLAVIAAFVSVVIFVGALRSIGWSVPFESP